MTISEIKAILPTLTAINFRLPDGALLPAHFHVTEVGLISRHFIDCGGVERYEQAANFQLWEAGDYDHRLAPKKFLHILELSAKVLGRDDLNIEVEYQQATISRFDLAFDGTDFRLLPKQTACLAQDACGIPAADFALPQLPMAACTPGGGCC
ncbi:DUF6428 family protein [Hymenobacter aerophilus]|uniref:DUF6428 family protein n=1 Tax=Hymenobacter aerophilus TaxID=119644 RepID=UPI000373E0BE|nr:DUF6428 family protein [Hymenobacter aerophilus]